ncbi:class I SAM-dependent methyltransferase [Actinomadura alba]|uniref:Class I SAM-dependent methyltransferase n=1 Tax=Actinomadura alba TaxID=406431 RepID=A0ABR7LLL5_9ACTN|nr:class I SAM-dependent methyltransferase [Actinomadura alba]MBC6465656.1 class I SAM-dependent methyltransferase [Actinomadura alba]
MVSPSQIAPLGTDPYVFQPGYYDLFRAVRGEGALPNPRFFADRAPQGGSALEIGPGTGRVTLAVAERVASVVCLERSATMRAVLLAKLAERPHLLDRVTVLESAAPTFRLGRRFDFVYLAGVLEHVPPRDRGTLFATLVEHLADDGEVAMDMVLAEAVPDWPERVVDRAAVGECRYEMSSTARRVDEEQAHLRFVYRTYHGDALVATEVVERAHYLHRPDAVLSDLAKAGLNAIAGTALAPAPDRDDDPGTLVARR